MHWDVFYKNNKINFYKDRHYIRHEFKELSSHLEKGQPATLLDYGCGVGNGFYPILEEFGKESIKVNACDISKTAIRLLKEHELYTQNIDAY